MGAAASACPPQQQKNVVNTLRNKLTEIKKDKPEEDFQHLEIPESFNALQSIEKPDDGSPAAEVYEELVETFHEALFQASEPEENDEPIVLEAPIKFLPIKLDEAIYQHERWALIHDPSSQGLRYLRYQPCSTLLVHDPHDMSPENLRKHLVTALQGGTILLINFDDLEDVSLEKYFSDDHFPAAILNKTKLFTPEVFGKLLRKDKGDPEASMFFPKDEFKLIVIGKSEAVLSSPLARRMCVIKVPDPAAKKPQSGEGDPDPGQAVLLDAFGGKEVFRNSPKMVEAAFDGEWGEVQELLDKGYSFESVDAHKHTPLSEAACQGHIAVVRQLLELGANPNAVNDAGRSPMYRAAFNGHLDCVTLLLEVGGDPRLKAGMEGPYDVAKTDEVRAVLEEWDAAETDRLVQERKAAIERKMEERITTAAERDRYARNKIREELVELALAGEAAGLQERLQELADEAAMTGEVPRGNAEARDERGHTLLLVAVWKKKLEVARLLLTHYLGLDPLMEKVERKVFYANPNAKDSKGWNACSLAVFNGDREMLRLLLEHGALPYPKNSYGKNAFDFAQDEKDAARNVVTDRSEIREVLLEWERNANPRGAISRKQLEEKVQEEAKAKVEADAAAQKGAAKGKGAKKKTKGAKGKKKGKK